MVPMNRIGPGAWMNGLTTGGGAPGRHRAIRHAVSRDAIPPAERCAPKPRRPGRRAWHGWPSVPGSHGGSRRRCAPGGPGSRGRGWSRPRPLRDGIGRGWAEWATSTAPDSQSTGGHSSRCQAKFNALTGMRASTRVAPGTAAGEARSFQELEKSTRLSSSPRASTRARASSCTHAAADTGALTERRAIIEQDAHARGIVTCPHRSAGAQ